jgi:hypothetical protein
MAQPAAGFKDLLAKTSEQENVSNGAKLSTPLRKQIARKQRIMRMIRENGRQEKKKSEAVMRAEVTFVH